jgi:hypothetical protein
VSSKSTQFKPGHAPTSPGNPLAGHAAKLRAALMSCATPADFKRLGRKLIRAADKGLDAGEVKALAELFDRLIGRATQPVEHEAGESLQSILERLAAAPPDA